MGYNMEGRIRPQQQNQDYIKNLEIRISELENLKLKKKKKSYNFDKLLSPVADGKKAWDW